LNLSLGLYPTYPRFDNTTLSLLSQLEFIHKTPIDAPTVHLTPLNMRFSLPAFVLLAPTLGFQAIACVQFSARIYIPLKNQGREAHISLSDNGGKACWHGDNISPSETEQEWPGFNVLMALAAHSAGMGMALSYIQRRTLKEVLIQSAVRVSVIMIITLVYGVVKGDSSTSNDSPWSRARYGKDTENCG
jgi:hypothetical protein